MALPEFLENAIRNRGARRVGRSPMDERTPDGLSVEDLAANVIEKYGTRAEGMGGGNPPQPWQQAIKAEPLNTPQQLPASVEIDDPAMSAFQPPQEKVNRWESVFQSPAKNEGTDARADEFGNTGYTGEVVNGH